ncbi:MAG: hypothetical protein CML04_06160 [Pseudozobellia sp.]|nr:hypothetical protein [Pseudozobellia sp.]MBG47982.1 hypothetical protein [Pseudozobellia sp.]|tara:strand:- start:408 stop:899 length:492 start_codon:yes stop_codon:yes gene_type:complete
MKATYLIIGVLIGAIIGFAATEIIKTPAKTEIALKEESTISETWQWPDDLDALVAAPDNHKVVYEDADVRILSVMLDGQKSEPIHTHKWRSVMWIAKPITPCQINSYIENKNGELVLTDSLIINEMPVDMGSPVDPEGPTSITNLGSDSGVAYRVEFKKEFAE